MMVQKWFLFGFPPLDFEALSLTISAPQFSRSGGFGGREVDDVRRRYRCCDGWYLHQSGNMLNLIGS